jgi:hypothetical protein
VEPSWNARWPCGVIQVMIHVTRALALGVVVLLGLASGCGSKDDAASPRSAPSAPPPADAALAAWNNTVGSELFWADARTLEPVDGRSVAVSYFISVAERSPDGRTLALGADDRGYVQLVDLDRMKSLGTIAIGAGAFIERLHWVTPGLLLASISGLEARVAALEPATRRVLSVHELEGTVLSSYPAGDELVVLLAPSDRIGPARLAVFDGHGVRFAELGGIRAGWEEEGDAQEDHRVRQAIPGLAVEPSGSRALVVPAGNRVAEVDLETMRVAYHDLAEPVSLLDRLLDWLEPAAEAKVSDGPERNAVWLPSGLVAVSGTNYAADGQEVDATPAGLALIDPSDWSLRRLSDEPNWVTLRGGALLASAWSQDSNEQTLIAFETDGSLRFTLTREEADLSQVGAGHLYAGTDDGSRYEIVDLTTGKTVGQATPQRPTWLVQTP